MSIYEYDEEEHMRMEREEWHEIGWQEGKQEGKQEGEKRFANLTQALLKDKRTDDLLRASTEEEYRKKLYLEYQL